MKIITNKIKGDAGEIEVTQLVSCPNCGKKLMLLPQGYPLYDVQCTACQFRAQVKTISSRPSYMIRGAGWDIIDKVMKSGFLVPPLIVNFKWVGNQEIRFYPFIKKKNLVKYTANIKSQNRLYKMFTYNLKDLNYYIVYKK